MPRELSFETWSVMREISGTITNRMALQSSPNKRSKVYGASSKVRLLPASVGADTKSPSPTDMLRLFSFDSYAIQNSPWPQEHLSSLSQPTPWNLNRKSRFNALSTCEWQFCPLGSLGATLIGPSTPTRFWVGKTGANQVWKVVRPAPYEIRRRTFLKV